MNTETEVWLITGAGGMLATDMVAALASRPVEVRAVTRADLDIGDPAAVARALHEVSVVINCAAYTNVDEAETHEFEAQSANGDGPGVIARACKNAGASLVHFSTDYVFDGTALEPYAEDAPTAPASAYGRTKADGERQVLASGARAWIIRTAWLYGANGPCFPKTIARVGAERGALSVVNDQIGQPTWTRDLAAFALRLIDANAPSGIYHGTSSGQASWFDFAREVTAAAGLGDIVAPTTSAEFPRPAPRPAWSVLGHDAATELGIESIGDWRDRWRAAAPEVLG